MSVSRKRFRIEQAILGDVSMPAVAEGGEIGPMHREIMAELRSIRAQMAAGAHVRAGIAAPLAEDRARRRRATDPRPIAWVVRSHPAWCHRGYAESASYCTQQDLGPGIPGNRR